MSSPLHLSLRGGSALCSSEPGAGREHPGPQRREGKRPPARKGRILPRGRSWGRGRAGGAGAGRHSASHPSAFRTLTAGITGEASLIHGTNPSWGATDDTSSPPAFCTLSQTSPKQSFPTAAIQSFTGVSTSPTPQQVRVSPHPATAAAALPAKWSSEPARLSLCLNVSRGRLPVSRGSG